MPPKAKVTKEMVAHAAFEVAHETGWENINARTTANRLDCSTQPVMYHFATIEELKKAAYDVADRYHTEYLMDTGQGDILLDIGLNYIRFAAEEKNLFRFLFQSGYAIGNNLTEIINSEELAPILLPMQKAMGLDMEQTKEVFATLAMLVLGYASLIANNGMKYNEDHIAEHLKRVYKGAVSVLQEENSK